MDCLISVIVPVYKVEKYIYRCVDSILAQTFPNFELILVDDGSPDNCGRICDEYALKDNRIHVIHKENGGLSDARNAGIDWAFEHSDSEWITFIDSDDWVHPDYLYFLYDATQKTGKSLSVCSFSEVNKVTSYDRFIPDYQIIDTESAFVSKKKNMIIACGKLFLKMDFLSIRFPVGKLHEDEFTIYKILFKYKQISYVDLSLYYYFLNQNSITNAKWTLRRLNGLEALLEQNEYFYRNRFVDAYAFSSRDTLLNSVTSLEELRKHYPNRLLIRLKYRIIYYRCMLRFKKFLSREEIKRIRIRIYPYSYRIIKCFKKRKDNLFEVIRERGIF